VSARAEPPEVNLQVKKTLRVFVYIIIDGAAAAVYLLPGSHKSVRDSERLSEKGLQQKPARNCTLEVRRTPQRESQPKALNSHQGTPVTIVFYCFHVLNIAP
jgi:hypothetical protein